MVVVREDLLGHAEKDVPILCDWQTFENSPDTYYNTPAVFPIYVTGLNCAYMNQRGGLDYYKQLTHQKSLLLWDFIDSCNGYFMPPMLEKAARSKVNVIFRIQGGDEKIEQ